MDHLIAARDHWIQALSQPAMLVAFSLGLLTTMLAVLILNYGKSKPVLDPTRFQGFPLVSKTQLSSNTARYRFALPRKDAILGLPIGQHLQVQADVNNMMVQRSYTPVSLDDDEPGFFDLVVKTYPQGNISAYIGSLQLGDHLEVKGPRGQMRYYPGLASQIGMIAGGTGLTPCLQVIRQILKDPDDKTKVSLIYANVKVDDILLKEDLDALATKHPEQFKIHYFLNEPPKEEEGGKGWTGGVGFITKEAVDDYLPKAKRDNKILMCGPPPMINACKKHLDELGFQKPRTVSKMEDQVFCF